MIGKTISHYKILQKLDAGGMGIVYKAEDTKLKRLVALKFLAPSLTTDSEAKERFINEAQTASGLDHPNICNIHEIDETDDGQLFICMAYYEGETLKNKIDHGPLTIDEAVDIAINIAQGLSSAHEAGIVHRDIKPTNIIITKRGEAKILDFGLAKLLGQAGLTKQGFTLGTLGYMSPEQAKGEDIDFRTDIWSLGMVLYEMLTTQLPFKGEYDEALVYSLLNDNPNPISNLSSDIPLSLEKIINKSLEKNPIDRYQSAVEFKEDLISLRQNIASGTEPRRVKPSFATYPFLQHLHKMAVPMAGIVMALFIILMIPPVQEVLKNWVGINPVPREKYLAVLPFVNVGGDSANQAFCDGLVETMSSKLTQLEQFQEKICVVPASEIRENEVASAKEAKQFFGANLAVTGSVQIRKNNIRLTINLIDTKRLRQLRSEVVDYKMANISAMQDMVVTVLTKMLEIEVHSPALSRINEGGTLNSNAYVFYLEGRGYLHRYDKIENLDIAISLFEQALKEDSAYALAFAALGETYLREFEATLDTQFVELAVQNCKQAIQLNDHLLSVHVTLGLIHRSSGRYEEAIQEFQKALNSNQFNSDAYLGLAKTHEALGNFDEAESIYKQVIRLRPDYWAGYNNLGVYYYHRGDFNEAAVQFRNVIDLTPDNTRAYSNLGGIYIYLERWSEAEEIFKRSLEIQPNYATYVNLGNLYFFQENRYSEAAEMFEKALELNRNDYRVWASLASVYWELDKQDDAYAAYQRAVENTEAQRKINPRDPEILAHLANFYAIMEDSTKAYSLVEQSLRLAPNDVEIIARGVETYEQLGQREKALKWIEIALKKGYPLTKIESTPVLQDLVKDVRFKSFIKELDEPSKLKY